MICPFLLVWRYCIRSYLISTSKNTTVIFTLRFQGCLSDMRNGAKKSSTALVSGEHVVDFIPHATFLFLLNVYFEVTATGRKQAVHDYDFPNFAL